jgi:hypothetical protein
MMHCSFAQTSPGPQQDEPHEWSEGPHVVGAESPPASAKPVGGLPASFPPHAAIIATAVART